MTPHLDWDVLNDLADGRLEGEAGVAALAHAQDCAECRRTFAAVRDLRAQAAALPEAVDPPPELWTAIVATIEPEAARSRRQVKQSAASRWFAQPWRLAAAAALLVAASSGLTVLVMQRATDGATSPVANSAPLSTGAAPITLPVAWQAAERGYLESVAELAAMLDDQRAVLSPATIASVERSLGIVDDAIAEARAALLTDPANAALADLLASNYRQKVELLRRASQLDPRS
jgi:hypothetical protein